MEEIEVPLEQSQEHLQHAAEHSGEKWISQVALSSAILAVLAAIAALMSGHHVNEAMISQIQSSDHWSYYQAKGIKASLLSTKGQLLQELQGAKYAPQKIKDDKKLAEYQSQQEETKKLAEETKEESEKHLKLHNTFSKSVTFFQVAIAIGAISALSRRRKFWYVSLGFGLGGLLFFILGFLGKT